MKTKDKIKLVKSNVFTLLCAACLLMISCEQKTPQGDSYKQPEEESKEDPKEDPQPTVYCSPEVIKAPFAGGEYSILLTAPSAWTATCNRDWVSLDTKSGQGTSYIGIIVEGGNLDSTNILFSTGAETAMLKIVRGTQLVESGRESGHGYVDLGLSVKWATCNIGASSPEEYGNYYAWGETTTKTNYSMSTYQHVNYWYDWMGHWNILKYCTDSEDGNVDNKTVLESSDDAAHVNWGGKWRMPTKEEYEELVNNCTFFIMSFSGVYGVMVTSKKAPENSNFFPYAGYYYDGKLSDKDYGYYWSSSLSETSDDYAVTMKGASYTYYTSGMYRCYGLPIRPVCQ